jgi:hypothetical protein
MNYMKANNGYGIRNDFKYSEKYHDIAMINDIRSLRKTPV